MTLLFEELDYQKTPLGEISLRRRADPRLEGLVIYEVLLGEEFLMSSLFTDAEIQLSSLGLAALEQAGHKNDLDIVVGGLGLGYTALAALRSPLVRSVRVIEVMQPVIDWHNKGLVPLGRELSSDPRCSFVHADFFAVATSPGNFDESEQGGQVHAVLLDIDHSPAHWLNPQNSSFYTSEGLQKMVRKILPGGIFGLWSNDPPDPVFTELLDSIFVSIETHVVSFTNPYTGGESANTVYLARVESLT
jgi:hypothetical protein